jgi:hypothetical protein
MTFFVDLQKKIGNRVAFDRKPYLNANYTFKWHLVFWVTIGSNTNLHLTLIYLFSVLVKTFEMYTSSSTHTMPIHVSNAPLSTKKHLINAIWEWFLSYLHQIFRYSIMNWGYRRAHLLKGRHYVLSCNILRKNSTYKLHMIRLTCSLSCLWITDVYFSFSFSCYRHIAFCTY